MPISSSVTSSALTAGAVPPMVNADSDLRVSNPQLDVIFDRERAADVGVPVAAVADSLRAVAAADSARRAAVPTVGWIQLVGDLPEDAILWLDTNQMNSRLFSATPGSHNVEVEADEFEPWERRVMVRIFPLRPSARPFESPVRT